MIYTILPEKDTYITNRVINNILSSNSNVGKAATLDLFKLINENDSVKSWAVLNILDTLPLNGETFTLEDANNNSVQFQFVENESNDQPGSNILGQDIIKIGLGTTPFTKEQLTQQISLVINKVNTHQQTGPSGSISLNITSYSSNTTILLEQNSSGEAGDNKILQSSSPLANLEIKKHFNRVEYSNLLLKFDLEDFKSNIIKEFNNSVFFNKSNYKAKIELIDITTGHAKPFDYSLDLSPLSKSFDEGLGKDTILFKDLDSCNFITASIDKSNNTAVTWGINNFLVENIDYYKQNNSLELTSTFNVVKGDENISFDITEYFHQFISNEISNDHGFVISLDEATLFNDSSYFVKRLGSKHLVNKKFIPRLNIEVNDYDYYLPRSNQALTRYFDTDQNFYLFNKQLGVLKDITTPGNFSNNHFSASLKYNNFEVVKKGMHSEGNIKKHTNLFGESVPGIYNFKVLESELSRFDTELLTDLQSSSSGSINFDLEWYWYNEGNNPQKLLINSEVVSVKLPENDDLSSKNIVSKITVNNDNLIANDKIQNLSVFLIDTKKRYLANKKPYDIQCEKINNISYRVIDTYDNSTLIEYDKNNRSTELFFNGTDYDLKLFVSSIFKNKTIRFEFIIEDKINGSLNIIKDKSKVKVY